MKISKHFTYKEALYLPSWKRRAKKKDGFNREVLNSLKVLFEKMDLIRDHFNAPVIVHVAYRPTEYNKLVGGAPKSSHVLGMACDFHVKGVSCDDVRKRLLPKLEEWGLRMEDLPGSNWVHVDIKQPAPGRPRFFKP